MDSTARIDALFRAISVRGGSQDASLRVFSRQEIAGILNLDLAAISRGGAWSTELATRYRTAIKQGSTADIVVLKATVSQAHPALRLQGVDDKCDDAPYAVDSLLSAFKNVAIEGPTGSGKSTTLDLLIRCEADGERLPILVSPVRYTEGTLLDLIQEVLERFSGASLTPAAVATLISQTPCILFVDGLTERPVDELNTLRRDLIALMKGSIHLRVGVSGRLSESFRLPGFSILSLEGLGREHREGLARTMLGPGEDVTASVDEVDARLGELSENPLMFRMALSLKGSGWDVFTRASLYRGLTEGLWAKHPQDLPNDLLEEVLSRIARELVQKGQFRTNRSDWRQLFNSALASVVGKASFNSEQPNTELIFEAPFQVGLVRYIRSSRDRAFLHDSLRDYFASLSYRQSSVGLPSVIVTDAEPSLELHCEAHGADDNLVYIATEQNPILACRLAPFARRQNDGRDAARAHMALRNLLDHHRSLTSSGALSGSTLGVRVCWTPANSWIAVAADEIIEEVTTPAELSISGIEPLFVISERSGAGPLALAVGAWKRLIYSGLRDSAKRERRWHQTADSRLTRRLRQSNCMTISGATRSLKLPIPYSRP
jgi:hypothetical protein